MGISQGFTKFLQNFIKHAKFLSYYQFSDLYCVICITLNKRLELYIFWGVVLALTIMSFRAPFIIVLHHFCSLPTCKYPPPFELEKCPFCKWVRISPEIEWYHYQGGSPALTCIVRHQKMTKTPTRLSVTSEPSVPPSPPPPPQTFLSCY